MWVTFGDRAPRGSGAGAELTQTPHPRQDTQSSQSPLGSHWDGLPQAPAPAAPTKTTCKDLLFFGFFIPFHSCFGCRLKPRVLMSSPLPSKGMLGGRFDLGEVWSEVLRTTRWVLKAPKRGFKTLWSHSQSQKMSHTALQGHLEHRERSSGFFLLWTLEAEQSLGWWTQCPPPADNSF